MVRIDGNAVAAKVMEETRARIAFLAQRGIKPGLAVVLVGDDPASRAYVSACYLRQGLKQQAAVPLLLDAA